MFALQRGKLPLDRTEARRAEKNVFGDRAPPYLSCVFKLWVHFRDFLGPLEAHMYAAPR